MILRGWNSGVVGVHLDSSPILIGRHTDADLKIEAPGVHRRHAVIARYPSGWMIFDLGSMSGIQVNQVSTKRARLYVGQKLRIASIDLTIEPGAEQEWTRLVRANEKPTLREPAPFVQDVWLLNLLRQEEDANRPRFGLKIDVFRNQQLFRTMVIGSDATLGSNRGVGIELPKYRISGQHCLFTCGPDNWTVHDLKSTTGILVENTRVTSYTLDHPTELQVGEYHLKIGFAPYPKDNLTTITNVKSSSDSSSESTSGSNHSLSFDGDEGSAPTSNHTIVVEGLSKTAGVSILPTMDDDDDAPSKPQKFDPESTPKVIETVRRAEMFLVNGDCKSAVRLMLQACAGDRYNVRLRRALRNAQRVWRARRTKFGAPFRSFSTLLCQWKVRQALHDERYIDAIDLAEKGLTFHPDSRALLLLQAAAFESLGEWRPCIWTLKNARKSRPLDPHINRPLAKIHTYLSSFAEALHYWRLVAKAIPESAEVDESIRAALVKETVEKGQYKDAIDRRLTDD